MAKEESIDEKKPGEDGQPPVNETILATSQNRDPEEAALAEQALRHFIRDRLANWYDQVEGALDSLEAWVLSQPQEDQTIFSERGFFDSLGDRFIGELFHIAGGKGTPIMDVLAKEVDSTVSFAEHSTFNISIFINEMRRGVRDACWYMRDACQAVLSNQWSELLDLATGGSIEFVPALFTMGLPSDSFKPALMADNLSQHSDAYRNSVAPRKDLAQEKANEKQGVDEQQQAKAEEDAQKMQEEEEVQSAKKESQAATI